MVIVACVIFTVLSLLSLFQLALIAGAPLGHFAWGGKHRVLPLRFRLGSVVAIGIYAAMAMLAASKAGLTGIVQNGTFLTVGLWVVAGYLLLGTLANAMSKSKSERLVMTPVIMILAVCFIVLALE